MLSQEDLPVEFCRYQALGERLALCDRDAVHIPYAAIPHLEIFMEVVIRNRALPGADFYF
jgi:hypothetical protein